MAKKEMLTVKEIEAKTTPGRFGDGITQGLYLSVTKAKSGKVSRAFVYRYTSPITSKIREAGLGSYPGVSLAEARETAREFAKQKAQGLDPLIERERERAEAAATERAASSNPTFEAAAEAFLARYTAQKNAKGSKFETATLPSWRSTLANHVLPRIGKINVADIRRADVAAILGPLSLAKGKSAREGKGGPTVALAVRSRLENIFDFCVEEGWRSDEIPNPASRNFHKMTMGAALGRKTKNHRCAALDSVPALWARLAQEDDTTSNAIRFIIATGVRLREALDARWDEVDFATNTFTIPAKRMKKGVAHVVPLSAPALAILEAQKAKRTGGHIFPGRLAGSPMASVSPASRLRSLGLGEATSLHGFRSNIFDFVTEHFDRELAERILAHKVGSEVTAAYMKTTLLAKRRVALEAYARFLTGEAAGGEASNVVQFAGGVK
ncbi:site-specific integrase [Rhodoblastus sp.]|jgi:integrase|uniref:tyrosine-type recombinase/integrase n=1 Tax=Rhodoblastus sp. TaxID=1962975 RepID=UPI0025D6C7F1|nr:site-specific integrase [Rhodoblastus sp.]